MPPKSSRIRPATAKAGGAWLPPAEGTHEKGGCPKIGPEISVLKQFIEIPNLPPVAILPAPGKPAMFAKSTGRILPDHFGAVGGFDACNRHEVRRSAEVFVARAQNRL
jgi:hypothetical protein